MNEPSQPVTKKSRKRKGAPSRGIDLKAVYRILLESYLENHPNALQAKGSAKDKRHE